MATSARSRRPTSAASTFWSEEHLARTSRSPVSEEAWAATVVSSRSSFFVLLNDCGPAGCCGRTSPAFCRPPADGRGEPACGSWATAGTGGPTGCATLSFSEYPSDGVGSSLSDILETGDHLRRYFLSARACRGILRRAASRAKTLPPALEQ